MKKYVPFCLWISTWIMLQQAVHWRTGAKAEHCKGGYLFTTVWCGGYNHIAEMPTKGHNRSVQSQVPEETFWTLTQAMAQCIWEETKTKSQAHSETLSNLAPDLLRPILLLCWHRFVCVKRSYQAISYVLLLFLFFSLWQTTKWLVKSTAMYFVMDSKTV